MNTSEHDRGILRGLALRVAAIAAEPIQRERAGLIKSLNELKPVRPVVLAFPEGGWNDLLPDSEMKCRDPLPRQWERALRMKIYQHEQIGSDVPVLDTFTVAPVYVMGDFGVTVHWDRPANRGAGKWDPPIKTRRDFEKLRWRQVGVDRAETQRQVELAAGIFGDILKVRVSGQPYWTMGLTMDLIYLRGLEQVMLDIYDDPRLLHDLMAFLRDSRMRELDTFEREGLLHLNNGPEDYVGSGGLGYTDQLPQKDFDGKARVKDLWGLCESQEFVGVGPEQFNEFALQYQLPVINRFGLVCYGCCEGLAQKVDLVKKHIPNLRRVSVSPWFDVETAARKLENRYVFSWKPNPALVCGPSVDWANVQAVTRHTLEATRGCCVEMIMKDTHTFHGDKDRIRKWTEMCLRLAEEFRC